MITPETFTQSNRMLIETLINVANTALVAAEQVVSLNTQTAQALARDSAATTKAMMDAKTPQELVTIQVGLAQPGMEKAVAYSRNLYEIATQAQEAFAQQVTRSLGR